MSLLNSRENSFKGIPKKPKIEKVALINKSHLKLQDNFSAYESKLTTSRIKGKPFDPDLYSLKIDFASEEFGTKIIAHSKTLSKVSNILEDDSCSYMLTPCNTSDWFVLSFPESILIQEISFLSFEYYSSVYKKIRISITSSYPSGKWLTLGELETDPSRNEIFDLSVVCNTDKNDCWGKYLKVELLDYHKLELNYYCSITKMMVFGITAVEYLETEISDDSSLYNTFIQPNGTGYPPITHDTNTVDESSVVSSKHLTDIVTKGNDLDSVVVTSKNEPPVDKEVCELNVFDESPIKKLSDLKCFGKSLEVLNPTFVYDIKNVIVKSFYKFLMRLALRKDDNFHNKKLIYRVLKIGKIKKYCGTNFLFQFDCNRFITHLLLEKYSVYYSNILDRIKLPSRHLWHVISRIMNDVGIKEVPILVCTESIGFISKFKCYFYFNLKSFSTLLFTQFTEGYRIHSLNSRNSRLNHNLLSKLYFFYVDNKITVMTAPKFRGLTLDDESLVKRYDYKVKDKYISTVTVINNKLYVNMSSSYSTHFPFDIDPPDPKLDNELIKANTSLYKDNLNRLNMSKRFDQKVKFHEKEKFKHHNYYQDENTKSTDSKTHKHVLLKLSERIKSLEFLTNKLSNKIYQLENLLNFYIKRQFYYNQHVELERELNDEFEVILKVLDIKKYKLVVRDISSLRNALRKSEYYYKRIKQYNEYETSYLYIKTRDLLRLKKSLCKLTNCTSDRKSFKRSLFLCKLSKFYKLFNKRKLAKSIANYGCKCVHSSHFHNLSLDQRDEWLYMDTNDKYNVLLILNDLVCFFRDKFSGYFNFYFLFLLYICTQIFWICKFNSHDKKIRKLLILKNN
uniref:Sad1 / UNC-like C-terminal, putative n=1 Tax=Theileria annulata TaxID=5874 RepID=A0A3B0MFJ7_THEAN